MAQRPFIPEDEAGPPLPLADQEALVNQYLANYPIGWTAGKMGEADEGLEYYSKIPGERVFVNGQYWIHDPANAERPHRPYTADHAIDPRTGQIYEPQDFGKAPPAVPPAGSLSEIPGRVDYMLSRTPAAV